jgi:tetratricopeptide (TPR) repeat protein
VDAESDRGKAVAVLDRLRWPFGRGFASAATLAILEIAQRCLLDRHRPLPLPSSFLLDEEGRLAVLYKGSVPVGQLLSDLERLRASPQARLAGAFPFPGRWHAPPPPFDPEVLVRALEARGHAAAARDLEKTRIAISPSSPARIHHEIGLARAREGQLDVAVDLFRRAADLEPGFFEARRDLATALHQRGDLEGAIAEYRAALSIRPADSKTLFNFAVACAQSGDRDGALRAQRWLGEVDGKLAADLLARLRSDRGW